MEQADKRTFATELTLTIQCLTGTIKPPISMLNAYFEALSDLPLTNVVTALRTARSESTKWTTPKTIRIMVEGSADVDEFYRYMDAFICQGRAGQYNHPVGQQVVRAMGGSSIFSRCKTFERKALEERWTRTWKEISHVGRVSYAPVSQASQ